MKETNIRTLVTTIVFAFLSHAIPAWSASFDCNKASTDAEIAICNDPKLSSLDDLIGDIFFNLDKDGRYYKEIVESQREWIRTGRSLDTYDFKMRAEFLEFSSVLNSCSKGEKSRFKKCNSELTVLHLECMEKENYSTLVMNRCGSSLYEVHQLVETFETNLWRKINSDDIETLVLFSQAYELWKEYVDADCDWQYSEYRNGTIRGQIMFGCRIRHYKNRILLLNGSNRFDGKDNFLDKSSAKIDRLEDDLTQVKTKTYKINEVGNIIRNKLVRCWNPPVGDEDALTNVIILGLKLDIDGKLMETPVNLTPNSEVGSLMAFEAARRAAIRCSPYNDLDPDMHESWKELNLIFNPKNLDR